ncbi:MAG: amidohydrolase family protein, partial [Anaerovorax sp.]
GGHDPFHGIMADGPWEVLKAVRAQVAKGASVIKISATGGVYGRIEGEGVDDVELRQEEVDMIVDESHRRNVKVTAHAIGESGIRGCLQAGIDCIEHGHCITEDMAAEMKRKNIALVPTFYIYQHLSSNPNVPAYARKKASEIIERHRKALKYCYAAGITIGAGSDAGSPYSPHPSLIQELYALAEGSMDNADVIKAATGNAAVILGAENNLGFTRSGYLADLILTEENPIENLSTLEKPSLVIKNGKIVWR